MSKVWLFFTCLFLEVLTSSAQVTFPVNGVADERQDHVAFINATIVKDAQTIIKNGTLIIKEGRIVKVGSNLPAPANAVVIDCSGKYIYPSFIELYSNYGMPAVTPSKREPGFTQSQFISNTKGAFDWNQAIHPETNASQLFSVNNDKAKDLRNSGFGMVVTHVQDGIARGSGALVSLADENENLALVKQSAADFFSFEKGTSTQDYPTSLMGAITLLRQTYLNGKWYSTQPEKEGTNLSLLAWNNNQNLPHIFNAADKWNSLRANKIASEFNVKYIIKGGGNEYQRIDEMKAANAPFILPINFPLPYDISDINNARLVALSALKHWEMAPLQPGMFEKANIDFALSSDGSGNDFLSNLRKAIENGLSEKKALDALTRTPATLIGMYNDMGSIETGKLANFLITSGPVFQEKTLFFQNWIQGRKYVIKDAGWNDLRGNYKLTINKNNQLQTFNLEITGQPDKISAKIKTGTDTAGLKTTVSQVANTINILWNDKQDSTKLVNLTGVKTNKGWAGVGYDANGFHATWQLEQTSPFNEKLSETDTAKIKSDPVNRDILYPFSAYGFVKRPGQQDLLIKNASVWTNESDGLLLNTDVLVKNGKIAKIGKNLSNPGGEVIDGTNKYVSAGIIDEHSHIAISGSVNECSQSVTAEVRVADVIDPDDINIYRQLAGGVTSAHLLHGSCNTIGGQTQLIKLTWGANAEDLKFANWDPFIKFALGENVKRSYNPFSNRFPDTRMGVEQVIRDAFQRAKDYEKAGDNKRRDLELDALVEILNGKRFITCHSYVQSEINMMMHIADEMGFKVNTFTHILEGYKVADKMKEHGANASTFSDWWMYKAEVQDAIPYNAAIMHKVGVNVAINSDDPEMARHLNQEAAKTIKYGNLSEADAFNMATLNPAVMLHISDRVGSLKAGKDADLVIWSDNPLSVYSRVEKTIVDGIVYFDMEKDKQMQQYVESERNRIIQKMIGAKKSGGKTTAPVITPNIINRCEVEYESN